MDFAVGGFQLLCSLHKATMLPRTKFKQNLTIHSRVILRGAPTRQCFFEASEPNNTKLGKDISIHNQPMHDWVVDDSINFHSPILQGWQFCTAYFSQLGSNVYQIWGEDRSSLAPFRFQIYYFVSKPEHPKPDWGRKTKSKFCTFHTPPCKNQQRSRQNNVSVDISSSA